MVAKKKSNFYLTREELVREIILSKQKHRESNYPKTPAECFTPKLTEYLQLLVSRYANKGQWRGYCVDEQTECLTKRGWLKHDQVTEQDLILSYTEGQLAWSRIKSIYRGKFNGKMFKLDVQGLDALVTPGHKFLTTSGLKTVEHLREKDKLVLLGKAAEAPAPTYSDAFVELVGWTVTEGCYDKQDQRNYTRITVYQNEGEYADRIRACLDSLNSRFSECGRPNPSGHTNIAFNLTKDICEQLVEVAPAKVPTMNFILALTKHQRKLLIHTMIDADGHRSYTKYLNYTQCDKAQVDAFLALCTITGYRTSTHKKPPVSYGKKPYYSIRLFSDRAPHSVVENIDFHGAKNSNRVIGKPKSLYPNEPSFDYNGQVWCPETEYGTFVARRNGYIYLTGNSYIEDMKSDALVTLCQNCFKYDETRFDNPFGYLTQIVKYCFITFLEKEEIVRDIKDSLWESIGMTPSYARQLKNEMLREVGDTSTKGLKLLKRDVDALQEKVDAIANIGSRVTRLREPDAETDFAIAELLELDPLPYTGDRSATLVLFREAPDFRVEEGIEVAGQIVNCISVHDASTSSQTKRIILDTEDTTVTLALCAIGLSIRRDLLVKKLREISGYNLSPRFPTEEKPLPDAETEGYSEFPAPEQAKRRKKRPS